jgi:hypothetical protein
MDEEELLKEREVKAEPVKPERAPQNGAPSTESTTQ